MRDSQRTSADIIDIDAFYSSAFDRRKMPQLLAHIVSALGAQAGFLGWSNLAEQTKFEIEVGNDPVFLQSYVEKYWQHDLLRPTLYAAEEDRIMLAHQHLIDPEVRKSVFYKEWLEPQNIVDNLAVNIFKRPELIATIAILRIAPAPPFSPESAALLAQLLPHLKRAIYIQSRLIQNDNVMGAYRQVMQNARDGLLLLNAAGQVVDSSRGAEKLTGLKPGQSLTPGVLGKAITETIATGAPVAVQVTQGDTTRTLLCVSQPVASDSFGDLAEGPGISHAVHIIRIDQQLKIGLAALAKLYGLTATETLVLADALDHADTKGAGDRIGMARATVRTHLHRIYDKTATAGLPDLLLLAHRFALPNDAESAG